jgi:hypothetical protein
MHGACSVCTLLTPSCDRGKLGSAPAALAENTPARGEHVVIEQTAAVFFEGRVLAVGGQGLRVQATSNGDALSVAHSDVYRLSGARREQRVGHFAICGRAPSEWVGCRIERVEGSQVRVVDAQGQSALLAAERVLSPTPVTELNLRRYFERVQERVTFARAAERAGTPRAPANWKPSAHERVLARNGAHWYSARVRELDDEDVTVLWEFDERPAELTLSDLVPAPPYVSGLKRGDFVLVRPELQSHAWAASKVVARNGAELEVVDINGARQSVSAREVVPLQRP